MINSNHMWFSEGSRFVGGMHGRGGPDFNDFGPYPLFTLSIYTGLFLLALLWTVAIKGFALWTAAQRREKWWFIALLVINTFGLLEIAYLLFFAKKVDLKTGEIKQDAVAAKHEAAKSETNAAHEAKASEHAHGDHHKKEESNG